MERPSIGCRSGGRRAATRSPGLVAGLAAAAWLGCASDPPPERVVLATQAPEVLLILPFNVTAVMPPQLESPSPVVWDALAAYLQDQGKELKTVNPRDARRIWLGSIRKARAGEEGARAGYEEAAEWFVRELTRYAEFDRVLSPSLFVREAVVSGHEARWDGVARRVELDEAEPLDEEIEFEGVAPAASLHLVLLDDEGRKLRETLRGLELLVRVRPLEDPGRTPEERFAYAERRDLFQDRALLREEVAAALDSLLARPE